LLNHLMLELAAVVEDEDYAVVVPGLHGPKPG